MFDYLITYQLGSDPTPLQFEATARTTGAAIQDLVDYVTKDLGLTTSEISNTKVTCEGPSTFPPYL
ncbi:hypothetical protein KLER11_gp03 [Pararheinheimera phage vB_PsoM_KLER1-1]|nr:hypothetical protein KLER11_gp03 [Pararheinheimera phage vB_PsoM_KLER1-1]